MDVKIPRGPLMPFKADSSAPPSPPELSLAHYAEVWAGIWLAPQREAEIRARFNLQSDAVWNAVRHVWHQRFQADPELEKRFRHIIFHHYALSGKPPPQGGGEGPR